MGGGRGTCRTTHVDMADVRCGVVSLCCSVCCVLLVVVLFDVSVVCCVDCVGCVVSHLE